jgi:hypothetical protein
MEVEGEAGSVTGPQTHEIICDDKAGKGRACLISPRSARSQRLRVVAVAAMSGSIPVHANLVEQVEYTGRIGSGNKLPVFGKFFPPGGDQTRA